MNGNAVPGRIPGDSAGGILATGERLGGQGGGEDSTKINGIR